MSPTSRPSWMRQSWMPSVASIGRAAWLILAVVTAMLAVGSLGAGRHLRTDLLELLPDPDQARELQRAADAIDHEVGRTAILLFGHADPEIAAAAATRAEDVLSGAPEIESVQGAVNLEHYSAIAQQRQQHRSGLLTLAQIQSIERDGGAALAQQALARLFGPLGAGSTDLEADPFYLLPDQLIGGGGAEAFELHAGRLWTSDGRMQYTPVIFRTRAGVLALTEQRELAVTLQSLERESLAAAPDLEVLRTGIFFYAEAGARSAQREISIVGTGSLLGILLLVLTTFRSVRPLTQSLISIGIGLSFALAATLAVFGSIHVFTLVIGASLIGVSVDYSFHYATEASFGARDWTPERGIAHILPGITLGLLTSVIAFAALTVAPFPGLRQLAVFSAVGLFGSYLTVLIVFPAWRSRPAPVGRPLVLIASDALLAIRRDLRPRAETMLLAVLLVLAAASVLTLDFEDDIRDLQSRPPELLRQEQAVVALTGADVSAPYLVLSAADADSVLALEEALQSELGALVDSGALGGAQGVAAWVPSSARQARSRDAFATLVDRQLPGLYSILGLEPAESTAAAAALMEDAGPLTIEAWLQSDASADLRHLWLGQRDGVAATVLLLSGVRDPQAIAAAFEDRPGVTLVDRAAVLSQLFAGYRIRIAWLLLVAYIGILALLAFRYGASRSFALVWPPVVSGALALGLLAMLGVSLNLFNLLALILVLGVGIDFTLFLAEAHGRHRNTYLAVSLSAATTVLSFGLLAASQTHAIRSFGATVLIGIILSYLLAPMSLPRESRT
jgi:predicted exporter